MGDEVGDSPIGGGLLGVAFGLTPDPGSAATTSFGGVTGDPAFGGVTGLASPFFLASSVGRFKALCLTGGGVTRLGPALSETGPPVS